jgi:hypothetical protein
MRDRGTVEQRFEAALENAERFFMKTGKVHQAALAIARRLDQANIPYAIAGAMALGAHGYERVTVDVDVLLTREGLARFKKEQLGEAAIEGERFRILTLPKLVELKLASGMTAPHRLKDLADVLELVPAAKLPAELAASLNPYVREKYEELWRAAQIEDPE